MDRAKQVIIDYNRIQRLPKKDVSSMRKQYDTEYKRYACRLIIEEKQKMSEVSRNLDLPYGTLKGWIQQYEQEKGWVQKHQKSQEANRKPVYKTPSEYEKELATQAKELTKLQEENAILKKAMHVFTQSRE